MRKVIYLHGFASGPGSRKGIYFRDLLARRGVEVDLPDLAEGDFRGLTITRQLALVDRRSREIGSAAAIGSSLGGYLAALHAARNPGLHRALVLLAPGFGFARRWPGLLGKTLELWRQRGWMEVFHHATGRPERIGHGLLEDAARHEDHPDVRDPTLIIHGARDEVVPIAWSQEFAEGKPNVRLEVLDSDHGLLDVLDRAGEIAEAFLEEHGVLSPRGFRPEDPPSSR